MTQTLTEQAIEPAVRAWTRLLRAYALTTRLLSAELQEAHGLTINDFEALLVLSYAEGGRLKRVELARNLLLTPSGITRLLRGLEDAGFVERASCSSDLRVTYAQLFWRFLRSKPHFAFTSFRNSTEAMPRGRS